jgi:hypothetical protein
MMLSPPSPSSLFSSGGEGGLIPSVPSSVKYFMFGYLLVRFFLAEEGRPVRGVVGLDRLDFADADFNCGEGSMSIFARGMVRPVVTAGDSGTSVIAGASSGVGSGGSSKGDDPRRDGPCRGLKSINKLDVPAKVRVGLQTMVRGSQYFASTSPSFSLPPFGTSSTSITSPSSPSLPVP